jgi:hypothetical protein
MERNKIVVQASLKEIERGETEFQKRKRQEIEKQEAKQNARKLINVALKPFEIIGRVANYIGTSGRKSQPQEKPPALNETSEGQNACQDILKELNYAQDIFSRLNPKHDKKIGFQLTVHSENGVLKNITEEIVRVREALLENEILKKDFDISVCDKSIQGTFL